ncbi:MAG: 50S ribosomal protein L23 [bacterium]|jgi:large subunit ribosomal protein L23
MNTTNKINTLSVLKKPRITEKAGIKAESENVYTFEVTKRATKKNVREAVMQIYKVNPVKVNITKLPVKITLARGKRGVKGGAKKAVVYLKKGEKITFI